jgi:hypothetical protein
MKHTTSLACALAAVLLVATAGAVAADTASAVGVWDVMASTPDGAMPSVLTVTSVEGKIKAEVELGGTKCTVSDETLEGNVLRLKVQYEGETYTLDAKIEGDAMDGTWAGGGNVGTLKAKRRP